jgi:sugar phosphate isomerase/epimerase
MKLAIRSQDIKAQDTAGLIRGLEECRLDGLQLVCYKTFPHIKYEPGQLDEAFLSGVGAALRDAGKEIYLIGAYFNPVHSDPKSVQKSVEIFKEYIRYAALLGCPVVGSETGSYHDDVWVYHPDNRTATAVFRAAAVFRELCGYAEKFGVKVAIEGAAGHVAYDPDTLDAMLRAIGKDNTAVVFDLFNYLDRDNHVRYLEILRRGLALFGGKIRCFHLKDYVVTGDRIRQVAVGKGRFDYRRILRAVKKYDRDAVLVLEGTTGDDILPAARLIRKIWENDDE